MRVSVESYLPNPSLPVNRKPPWSRKEFVSMVRLIEHHDVVSSVVFVDEYHYWSPPTCMKQALITLQEATEAYMLEVTAEFQY
jgi:hypothetical protein